MNMNIQSKYHGGEVVYIIHYINNRVKFQQATITKPIAWEYYNGFMYEAKFTTADGVEQTTRINENEIYTSREEILTDLILDDYTKENEEQTEPTNEEEQTNEQ